MAPGPAPRGDEQTAESRHERGAFGAELIERVQGQALQDGLAGRPELHDHAPPVTRVDPPRDHAAPDEPIDQLDRAVVAKLQALGEGSDRHRFPAVQALRLQQEQILLRLDARRPRRLLSDPEEASEVVAKLRQGPVVDGARLPQNARPPCSRAGMIYRVAIYYRGVSAETSGGDRSPAIREEVRT